MVALLAVEQMVEMVMLNTAMVSRVKQERVVLLVQTHLDLALFMVLLAAVVASVAGVMMEVIQVVLETKALLVAPAVRLVVAQVAMEEVILVQEIVEEMPQQTLALVGAVEEVAVAGGPSMVTGTTITFTEVALVVPVVLG